MQALRLGAHKLPEAEVVLLRTLFRLFAYDKTFCWTLSSEAPYDALVVDANAPEAQSPEFRASVSAVLTLGPASAGDGPDRGHLGEGLGSGGCAGGAWAWRAGLAHAGGVRDGIRRPRQQVGE